MGGLRWFGVVFSGLWWFRVVCGNSTHRIDLVSDIV